MGGEKSAVTLPIGGRGASGNLDQPVMGHGGHAKAWTPNCSARCPRFSVFPRLDWPITSAGNDSTADWQLNLGEIILGIAFENHARALDINFSCRQGDFQLVLLRLIQNLRVAAVELIVRASLCER